jgi:SNF2 family DNA or RNA helicase
MKFTPRPYQLVSKEHVVNNPTAGLLLDMGLGKTASTLAAIDELMFSRFEIGKVLIIAPLKVAEDTWSRECEKWDDFSHFRISKVLGSEQKRIKALMTDADIYVINRENVPWLCAFYGSKLPFDMWVIDELSSFKSSKAARFRALKRIRPSVSRVVGLTGTPAPNGLIDLWAQIFLLDGGQRLGEHVTHYREQYFHVAEKHGNIPTKYVPKNDAEKAIYAKISDICISMKSEDYLQLPDLVDVVHTVTLEEPVMKKYKAFKRDYLLSIKDKEITALNAAALTGKLLQFSNGAVYDENRGVHHIHDTKMEAFEELIEEAQGKPVLVFYQFRHDLERIKKKFPQAVELKGSKEIEMWNKGKLELMIAHAASAGHGLNLQDGGNILIWFGIPWSLELYQQAIKRLHRSGQLQKVFNHILITKGTWEENVLKALQGKANVQDELLKALKYELDRI